MCSMGIVFLLDKLFLFLRLTLNPSGVGIHSPYIRIENAGFLPQ